MKKNLYKLFPLLLLTLLSCSERGSKGKTITIKGSDTMVILGQRWAENYMKTHPDIIIQITGGGSGTGIAALINATTNIAQASRPMNEEEKKIIFEKYKKQVFEIPVALDGITIYVNQHNPINFLTISKLRDIYLGKIKKWSELSPSWDDKQIVVYGRENNSGTYIFFKEHILENRDFADFVQTLPGTAAIVNAVSKDKYSIGYGGIAYAKGIKKLEIKKDEKTKPVKPTFENIVNGSYPISRKLFFYTVGQPQGEIKQFIDWVLSPEGQKICDEVGYCPLQ